MAARSLSWRGFGVRVEVPDRVSARLRRLRPNRQAGPVAHVPELVVDEHPAQPAVEKHRPIDAIRFFHNPDYDPADDVLHPVDFKIPLDVARTLTDDPDEAQQIADVIWYHTIELPGGVVTPGEYDHRPLVGAYGLPEDLTGKTALDVATNNGYWAFEMERRGATTAAIDVQMISELDHPPGARAVIAEQDADIPVGAGFAVAHRLLGSSVRKIVTNIYEMDGATTGTFDFVHIADVLLHLRDPLGALEHVRAVTAPDGSALIVDVFEPDERPGRTRYLGGWHGVQWWRPSLDTLAQMVLDAGFADVHLERTFQLSHAKVPGPWRAVLRATP